MNSIKRIAADLMKCGVTRVRIRDPKEVAEALTREDIRQLIASGAIWKVQKKGTSRVKARYLLAQRKRGRRRGAGSKKGHVRVGKTIWVKQIRAQRKLISELRKDKLISDADYRQVYLRSKGGMFRSKKHLLSTLKEKGMLKVKEKKA